MVATNITKSCRVLVKGVKNFCVVWPKYYKMKSSLTDKELRMYMHILSIISDRTASNTEAVWSGKSPTGIEILEALQAMTGAEFNQIYNAVLSRYLSRAEQHAALEYLKVWRDRYNIPANNVMLHYWMVSPGWFI